MIYFVVLSTAPDISTRTFCCSEIYFSQKKATCRCFSIYLFSLLMTLPVERLINNELEKAWKEAVVAYFQVLIWHLLNGIVVTEEAGS